MPARLAAGWEVAFCAVGAVFAMTFPTDAFGQTIRYVDVDTCPGQGSGTQGDPYCLIQDGIEAADHFDTVLVSPGTYFEAITFRSKKIEVRSAKGRDMTTIDRTGVAGFRATVTIDGQQGSETILDGFTVTGGLGSGIVCLNSSPVIRNNIVTGNQAGLEGPTGTAGGILIDGFYDTVILENNVISNNHAKIAGGISLDGTGDVWISRCTIEGNTATGDEFASDGGGIFPHNIGTTYIVNSVIRGNRAQADGGGIGVHTPAIPCDLNCRGREGRTGEECLFMLHLINTVISENEAGEDGFRRGGGGITFGISTCNTVTNCTFYGNTVLGTEGRGGAIAGGRIPVLSIRNTLLWMNTAEFGHEIFTEALPGSVTVEYSDVFGGEADVFGPVDWSNNIDVDPLFEDTANGNFRLMSGSPANDAGNDFDVPPDVLDLDGDANVTECTPLDLADQPRFADDPAAEDVGVDDPCCILGAIVDMGAYESPWTPTCGNGILDDGEQCDDGENCTGCFCDEGFQSTPDVTVDCQAICGNGIVDTGVECVDPPDEECDNGADQNSDTEPNACRTDCRAAFCGDGVVDDGNDEECDDGLQNSMEPNRCRTDCTAPFCGDGVIDDANGEMCDAGGESAECDTDCTAAVCGDGTLNETALEECDDGGESATCDTDCTVAECGDNTLNRSTEPDPEQCDGTDDGHCPGHCQMNCQCEEGFIIPTVSQWGLIVMLLLVVTAGTLVFARQRVSHV